MTATPPVGHWHPKFDPRAGWPREHGVRIRLNDRGVGSCHLDGHDISNHVRAFTLDYDTRDRMPILALTLAGQDFALVLEGVSAHLNPQAVETLLRLGWRPPVTETAPGEEMDGAR